MINRRRLMDPRDPLRMKLLELPPLVHMEEAEALLGGLDDDSLFCLIDPLMTEAERGRLSVERCLNGGLGRPARTAPR